MRLTNALLPLLLASAALAQSEPTASPQPELSTAQHVVVVTLENHSFSSVINNSSMPYLNAIAHDYAYGSQYYADTHPSIGNYFMLTTGQIITNNDNFNGTVSADNLVRHFSSTGKTWRSYAEGLPSVGYLGGDTGLYFRHHNPFTYFSDVRNSNPERQNLVPFTEFAHDLANGALPNYSFIIPNRCNDAHDCSLSTADHWLQANLGPLLANQQFQRTGLLLIVFDESFDNDPAHGGGHVALVAVGHAVKRAYASPSFYRHENLLSTVCASPVLYGCPGAGSSAQPMSDLFTNADLPFMDLSTWSVAYPQQGPQLTIGAGASDAQHSIVSIIAYLDSQIVARTSGSPLRATIPIRAGSHNLTVRAWNASGAYASATRTISVR
ncbi:MAG: alkaline phosphatase family protein [Acidobacteriaceae bacterium]